MKVQAGTAYRAPTLNELYWYDPYDVGNPNLRPEVSYNGEIGYSFGGKRLALDASVFSRLVFDQINWDTSQSPATPVNISQALLPGAEVTAKINLTDGAVPLRPSTHSSTACSCSTSGRAILFPTICASRMYPCTTAAAIGPIRGRFDSGDRRHAVRQPEVQ